MNKLRYAHLQIFISGFSLIILLYSFYLEYIEGLQPCPLCQMQRLCLFLILCLALNAIWFKKILHIKILTALQLILACSGIFFASRQLWLEMEGLKESSICMPGLNVLIHYLPWKDFARTLLWGGTDCAAISWKFLGLSMAAWSNLYFSFTSLIILYSCIVTRKNSWNS